MTDNMSGIKEICLLHERGSGGLVKMKINRSNKGTIKTSHVTQSADELASDCIISESFSFASYTYHKKYTIHFVHIQNETSR